MALNPSLPIVGDFNKYTGWAEYQDTQYTLGSPYTIPSGADTQVPNNSGTTRRDQLPVDIADFYDNSTGLISGRQGDGLDPFIYMKSAASTAAGAYVDLWIQIQSNPLIDLYRRTITFPKGNGVEIGISMSIAGFTYTDWAASGAKFMFRSSGSGITCWDIRYVFTRTHKAR